VNCWSCIHGLLVEMLLHSRWVGQSSRKEFYWSIDRNVRGKIEMRVWLVVEVVYRLTAKRSSCWTDGRVDSDDIIGQKLCTRASRMLQYHDIDSQLPFFRIRPEYARKGRDLSFV
jgi:hypothetical protein